MPLRLIAGFVTLVLALHLEFENRDLIADSAVFRAFERARLELLRAQTHETTHLGLHALARGIRYFPPIHYAPQQWHTMRGYAQFALREAAAAPAVDPGACRYCDACEPPQRDVLLVGPARGVSLLEQMEGHIDHPTDVSLFFDSSGICFLLRQMGRGWIPTC
ncbi:hypothetical protein C8R43DRAFT_491623 [Mycena crocata]|nr:hypothetical protein C8R43DRAFT_491623 [Mycena crocata]